MNSLLDWFTNYCLNNQLISEDKEAWFRYGLEKRVITLIILVPFTIIAVQISGFWTTLFFITSFYYLRSQTNGYHAKTHLGCFIGSILLELFFLLVIDPMLNEIRVLVLVSTDVIIVFALAPYNHPMMNLDEHEYIACKRAARIRCIQLALFCYMCVLCGMNMIAGGISLGCTMTSTLLILAKITERRSQYGSIEGHSECCTSFIFPQND